MASTTGTIRNFIPSFLQQLELVVPGKVSTALYPATYLSHLLQHAEYYLAIYASVLERLLQHSGIPKENMSVADIGAGNGLLGVFAKHCGFGKVWIADSDASFVEAAKNLAAELGATIEGFVCSDLEEVPGAWKDTKIDGFVGTDFIEHVYDLRRLFATQQAVNPAMISVFTTASNPANARKVGQLKKLQLRDEFEGGTPSDFELFGSEPHPSFFSIRKHIIERASPELSEEIVNALATSTRGMRQDDIIITVKKFLSDGKIPGPPQHPTNTCNPYSGSWTERILSFAEYKSLYASFNLRLSIYDGFYDTKKPVPQAFAAACLNKIIPILAHRLSPFILLVGEQPQGMLN